MTAVNIKTILDDLTEEGDVAQSGFELPDDEMLYLFGTKSKEQRDIIVKALTEPVEVIEPAETQD